VTQNLKKIWGYLNRDPHQEAPTLLDLWIDGLVLGLLVAGFVLIWVLT
jgi:hypothetical protein